MLIFAEKKQDVDAIHEYLLLKGVEAVSIHGGKGLSYIHVILSSVVKGHVPSYSDVCILSDYYFRGGNMNEDLISVRFSLILHVRNIHMLSLSVTPLTFHSRLKTHLFHKYSHL